MECCNYGVMSKTPRRYGGRRKFSSRFCDKVWLQPHRSVKAVERRYARAVLQGNIDIAKYVYHVNPKQSNGSNGFVDGFTPF